MSERKNFIIQGDNAFDHFLEFTNRKDIICYLQSASKVKNNEATSRVLNHWEKLGLLEDRRLGGKGWRRLSLLQLVWCEIIMELRKFGFPNEKILQLKKDLIKYSLYNKKEKQCLNNNLNFQYYIANALFLKDQVFFMAFENGEALFANSSDLSILSITKTIGNHIRIDINKILAKLFPNKDLRPKNNSLFLLKSEELELLKTINFGKFQSISVKLNDGNIEKIEGEKFVDKHTKIIDLLKSDRYQDITIKQRDGKIQTIQRKVLKKILS